MRRPPKPVCADLGLAPAEKACLTGFSYRAACALAHLRAAWLSADPAKQERMLDAMHAILAALRAMRQYDLGYRVLVHELTVEGRVELTCALLKREGKVVTT